MWRPLDAEICGLCKKPIERPTRVYQCRVWYCLECCFHQLMAYGYCCQEWCSSRKDALVYEFKNDRVRLSLVQVLYVCDKAKPKKIPVRRGGRNSTPVRAIDSSLLPASKRRRE